MKENNKRFADDRTGRERRKKLSEQEIKDLQLAGGVEGGMQAGSAGGPGEEAASKARTRDSARRPGR